MILIAKYSTAEGSLFEVDLFINDGVNDSNIVHGVKLGEFEYGSDSENDGLFFCEKFSLTIGLPGVYSNVYSALFTLLNKFRLNVTTVDVYKNNNLFFKGFVDKTSVEGDYKKQAISLSVNSNILLLKEIDPKTLNINEIITSAPGLNYPCGLLWDILLKTLKKVLPNIPLSVNSNLITRTSVWFINDYWESNTQHWGDAAELYYGSKSQFKDCAELVKSIINSLGCKLIIKDYRAVVYNRWYSGLPVNTLNNLVSISPGAIRRIEGLKIVFKFAGSDYIAEYGKCNNEGNYETMELYIAGGSLPGSGLTVFMPIYVPGYVAGFGNEFWTHTCNEFFTNQRINYTPLWQTIADNIWANYSLNRTLVKAGLKGIYSNSYLFSMLHRIENNAQSFIVKKVVENYNKGMTTVDLISVTDNVQTIEPECRVISSSGTMFTEVFSEVENSEQFEFIEGEETIITTRYPFKPGSVKLTVQGVRQASGLNYEELNDTQIKVFDEISGNTVVLLDYEIKQ